MTQPPDPQHNPFAHPESGSVSGQPMPPAPQPTVPSFIPPSIVAASANPKVRKGSSAGTIAFVAAVVVAAAGLGFAGGRLTAPASASARGNCFANGGFANGARGSFNPEASGGLARGGIGAAFGAGNISIDGQVTAVSSGSITIQTAGGQSVTLQVPSTVTYHTQAAGTSSDVAVGTQVQVGVTRGAQTAAGGPAASGAPGNGGLQMDVTDITVLSK